MNKYVISVFFAFVFTIVSYGEKIKVVATIFPNYDFARIIGGEMAEVSLLLPPGIEAHSYEPTPKDIMKIINSDILLYIGEDMEPWVHRLTGNLPKKVIICDISQGINKIKVGKQLDPHIWTDPILAMDMVDNITNVFIEADPAGKEFYIKNANAYKNRLKSLHEKIQRELSILPKRDIVFSGHMTFGYFSKRYNLNFITPYRSFSPDAEPTPKSMAKLITEVKKRKDKYIYFGELIDPKNARLISRETGAEILLLHGAHNLSKKDLKNKKTYLDIMEQNLENLKRGMKNE
jgi:zinc transport system substrate-binding protein